MSRTIAARIVLSVPGASSKAVVCPGTGAAGKAQSTPLIKS